MLRATEQRKANSSQDEVEIRGMQQGQTQVSPKLKKGTGKPHAPPGSNSFLSCAFKLPCRGATLSRQ